MKKEQLEIRLSQAIEVTKFLYTHYYTICWNFVSFIDNIEDVAKRVIQEDSPTKRQEIDILIILLQRQLSFSTYHILTIFRQDLYDKFTEAQFEKPKDDDDYDMFSPDPETLNRYIDILEWLLSSYPKVHTCKRWGMCFEGCNGKAPTNVFRPSDKIPPIQPDNNHHVEIAHKIE